MPSSLVLRVERDQDGTAELFVEAKQRWYAGASSAWFDLLQLQAFGTQLAETYPLAESAPIRLEGGYWNKEGSSLAQVHVGLKFYPVGATGTIGLHVQLATALLPEERPESQSIASFEMKTSYEGLRRFGLAIVALARGTAMTAELATNEA